MSVSMSVSMSISMSMSVSVPVSLPVFLYVSLSLCLFRAHVNFYIHGAMENYSEMYLLDSPGPYEVALELKKGLSHDIGWIKSPENLGASPFKRDPFDHF
jgi:hypothetical protein